MYPAFQSTITNTGEKKEMTNSSSFKLDCYLFFKILNTKVEFISTTQTVTLNEW